MREISESQLFRSKPAVEKKSVEELKEIAFISMLGLRIALSEDLLSEWAEEYVRKTFRRNKFRDWRTDGTDLYAAMWGILQAEPDFDLTMLERWLRRPDDFRQAKRTILNMTETLDVDNESLRAIRRLVINWDDITEYQQKLAITRLLQIVRSRYQRSELLDKLNMLAKREKLEIKNVYNMETGEGPKTLEVHREKGGRTKSSMLPHAIGAAAGYAGGYGIVRQKSVKEEADAAATTSADIATFVKPIAGVKRRTPPKSTD